jgi:hypothetical protein
LARGDFLIRLWGLIKKSQIREFLEELSDLRDESIRKKAIILLSRLSMLERDYVSGILDYRKEYILIYNQIRDSSIDLLDEIEFANPRSTLDFRGGLVFRVGKFKITFA